MSRMSGGPGTVASPFPDQSWMRGLVGPFLLAAFAATLFFGISAGRTIPLFVDAALVCGVLLDGRAAYLLLPISIPWGSLLSTTAAGVTVTPSDVIVGALLITFMVGGQRLTLPSVRTQPWLWSLVLLVLAMAVSLFTALSVRAAMPELIKWAEVAVVAALAPVYLRTVRDVRLMLYAIILSAAAEAALGLTQFAFHLGPKAFEFHHRFLRAYGTFGQPNPLAGYLNMVLPLAVAMGFVRRTPWIWPAAIIIAAGSAATLSRAGWVAGALGVLVVVLYFVPWLRPAAVAGGIASLFFVLLTVMAVFPVQPLEKVSSSLGLTGINFAHHTHANFSEIERAAHWVAGLHMFASHLLTGVGIGNYAVAYPAYHVANFVAALGHAHNYFINIAAEAGIVGLAAYTLFVVSGFVTSSRAARSFSGPTVGGALAIGAVGLWTSSTFHNLFDVLYVHELTLLIALTMGGLMVLMSPAGRTRIEGDALHDG